MAIKKRLRYDTKFGVPVEADTYARVARVEVNKVRTTATLVLLSADQSTRLGQRTVEYPTVLGEAPGLNPWKQAYQHTKSLPEFEGAEDV